jgi:hypothetical protein
VIQPKSITIESGKTQQFQAIIKDRYGNIVEDADIQWQVDQSIGSVTKEGIFTATKIGKGKLSAIYKDNISDNAEITVVYGEISRVEISIEDNGIKLNPPYTLLSGNRYLLGIQAYDSQGNKIEKINKINWKISEDRGLIAQSPNNEDSFILTTLFVGSGTISAIIDKASVTSDINIIPHTYNISYSKGAIIQGPLGIKLDIPSMALRNDEKISLSLTQSPGIIQKAKRIGYVLKIEPIGLILSIPAKLVFNYDYSDNINIAEDRLGVYSWDRFQKKWIRSGGYVDKAQRAVIVEINYLSQFAVMQDEGESEKRNENKIEVKLTPNAYFAPDINLLTISYNILWKSYQFIDINISIYDMGGNLVKELIRNGSVFPGWNTAQWNGKNESGETIRNGRYFVIITAESNGEQISKTSHLAVFK